MPRQINPTNAAQRTAQERYRGRLRAQRRPEADAVDTALAAAVAVYRYAAVERHSERDIRRAGGLELMAINFLVNRGYAPQMAERQVLRRVRRLDVATLVPMVSQSSNLTAPGCANDVS